MRGAKDLLSLSGPTQWTRGEEQERPVEGSGCYLLRQQQQGGSAGVCGHKAARDHDCIVTPNDHCKLLTLNSWQSPCLSLPNSGIMGTSHHTHSALHFEFQVLFFWLLQCYPSSYCSPLIHPWNIRLMKRNVFENMTSFSITKPTYRT